MSSGAGALTAIQTARAVQQGQLTARERVEAALERISDRDPMIGAFLDVHADAALQRAAQIDADASLRQLPLAGVPVAIKDNLCVQGHRTTAGSRILGEFRPPYNATCIERLNRAGAVIVGKTNLDEFAMGSSTETSAFRATVNPRHLSRVPGGSSGGSAAAVAAGMVPVALGSDTGGSVRQPAAFCGIVGLKPTYGRVSRYGLIAYASSLDQVGPMAADIADTALMLQIIAGHDPADATSLRQAPAVYSKELECDARTFRLGIPRDWLGEGLAPAVREVIVGTLEALEREGVAIQQIDLPHERYAIATYYVVATAEASSNLARYDGVQYGQRIAASRYARLLERTRGAGFGPEVKRRILLGTYVLSAGYRDAYYERARRIRELLSQDLDQAFSEVDAIVGPTAPTTAFARGEKLNDPLAMYLSDVFTVTANLAGLPALSVPCGVDPEGLPVGFQVIGPRGEEARVLQLGSVVERLRSADFSSSGKPE